MALTEQQRWTAAKIDTRMHKLRRAGKDDNAILAAMADQMPAFQRLLGTIQTADMEQLTRKFPGFYQYAKILEAVAGGIQSGAIPVPGRTAAPQPAQPTADHRQRAAGIDLRMRQLAEEGVPQSAIIDRMTAYVPDLGIIWNTTSDEQLAALCHAYPGFHSYAALMEEAAEAERRKPARSYDDLPVLPDTLKQQLSSLLSTAAKLERDYQSMLETAGLSASIAWSQQVRDLHDQWEAGLTVFRTAIQNTSVPQKSRDTILPVLERLAQQVGGLKARIQAL